jgi:hypothetical protein
MNNLLSAALNCTGCLNPITDMYYLNVGNKFYWHLQCLKCSKCFESLQSDSKCFLLNDGNILCSKDYSHLKLDTNNSSFIQNSDIIVDDYCRTCKLKINQNDYIIRLNKKYLYHLNCFQCKKCGLLIGSGMQFGLFNESVYCEMDYFKIVDDDTLGMRLYLFIYFCILNCMFFNSLLFLMKMFV